ncbi:MAG: hypothetical protein COY66_04875 [Candidatus Kerfeldbacteria bacterium CG_4_10_14_0_8_um_filter_42_10]|uniref:Methyltransferase domain-containing protein n=1 Tax=Candidatus Kerfeldbacteria bacterium CG_4_10_14_0_8_um_filter_42_10 TaxID=2014248 RepID=A0A2M7RHE1_9BACT|nr:MAG: hypothetical protein COY66_04875 [Candidatus Kerfeldbacteria bacterium CG_4_10_14_0_8_um_filter_42_10]
MLIYFLIFLQFILLLIGIGFVLYIGFIMISFKNTVPYVPTAKKVIQKMIAAAHIQEGDKAVDLGSGTGRIIFAVAKKYPIEVIGVEYSCLLYFASKIKSVLKRKKGKVKIIRADFNHYPLKNVNVVFCFLTLEGLSDIQNKLNLELMPGARIISYLFPLKKKDEFQEYKIPMPDGKKVKYIFVYTKLARNA